MKTFVLANQELAKLAPTQEELAEFITCAPFVWIKRAHEVITLTNWRGFYVFPNDPQEALSCAFAPKLNIEFVTAWCHLDYQEVCNKLSAALVPYQNGMVVTCLNDVLRLAPPNASGAVLQDLKMIFNQLEAMLRDIGVIVKEWLDPDCFEQEAQQAIADNQALAAHLGDKEANERTAGALGSLTNADYMAIACVHAQQAAQRMLDIRSKNCKKRLRRLARLAKQRELEQQQD